MAVRVVVTDLDTDGVSRFVHDGPAAAEVVLSNSRGVVLTYPWQVAVPPATVGDGHEPIHTVGAFVPPPGSLNFVQFVIPPSSPAERDPAQAQAAIDEITQKLPGLLPTTEPAKGAGMHRTATIDLFTVISGRPMLRLDDGSQTELAPGDCVVQRGTTHAWHNPTDSPCVLSGVMIGLRGS